MYICELVDLFREFTNCFCLFFLANSSTSTEEHFDEETSAMDASQKGKMVVDAASL